MQIKLLFLIAGNLQFFFESLSHPEWNGYFDLFFVWFCFRNW